MRGGDWVERDNAWRSLVEGDEQLDRPSSQTCVE